MSNQATLPAVDAAVEIQMLDHAHVDFGLAAAVRRRVFVEEQGVAPEEEWDADDVRAWHLLARYNGRAAGTLRFFDDGGWLHVGRVAVLPEFRSHGLGRRLMEICLEAARERGFRRSFLNAQSDKLGFYRKLGYGEVGREFMEAGIPHMRMELEL